MRAATATALWAVFPAILLIGCNAQGPEFSSAPDLGQNEAAIIVYRPSSILLATAAPDIYLDGQKRGTLKNAGYLMFRVPTGSHLVEAKAGGLDWDAQVGELRWMVNARPGQTHFVRLNIRSSALLPFAAAMASPAAPDREPAKSPAYFSEIDPPDALNELKGLRLSE